MIKIKQISSLQNPLVKKILVLKEKSRERKKEGVFVLEGQRELQLALKGNYQVEQLFFCEALVSIPNLEKQLKVAQASPNLISVTKEVYQKMAYRATTEGIVAVVKSKVHSLESLQFKNEYPLLLVAEATEKPGNLGALLRTADAANIDAVLIANAKSDVYNPNVIRSSVGCVFTNQIAMGSTSEIIAFLQKNKIQINCAALSASKNYTEINFKQPTAIVVGTEATGLTQEWLDHSTNNIIIPMRGEIDSMNVSVSAAILIFEAVRQREL